ncbi:MAG: class I SAM-dependent methyltransferase [Puniceicoccales bacterium]|nr:class I SAM-dependent methyltransferase [Puniceicoccales bacterium]
MNIDDQKQIFEKVYEGINGSAISHRGRAEMNSDDTRHLIYGEFSFEELGRTFTQPGIEEKILSCRTFGDLGSGTGRIAIGMSLLFPHFSKIIGVELVKALSETSNLVKQKYEAIDEQGANKIKFVNDNFFNVDFSPKHLDLDVIFMHYPMVNAEDLYLNLEDKMRKELKSGAVIVSAIRTLVDLDSFPEIAPPCKINCYYGGATMHYHKKV